METDICPLKFEFEKRYFSEIVCIIPVTNFILPVWTKPLQIFGIISKTLPPFEMIFFFLIVVYIVILKTNSSQTKGTFPLQ